MSILSREWLLFSLYAKADKMCIRDRIMCVLFTEEVGGILDMEFDEEGNLLFKSSADEGDLLYDEIACGMLVKKYQYEKRELLESLEMFFKVFFLGME